MFIASDILIFP